MKRVAIMVGVGRKGVRWRQDEGGGCRGGGGGGNEEKKMIIPNILYIYMYIHVCMYIQREREIESVCIFIQRAKI